MGGARRLGLGLALIVACGGGSSGGGTESNTGSGSSGSTGKAASSGGATTTSSTSPASGSGSAGGSQGSGSASASGSTSGTSGGPFVLDVHTVLTGDGYLALQTNLPSGVDDCMALAGDPPCDDVDGDGLTDAWEDIVIDRLRPLRRLDEAEPLFTDATAVIADVARVAPMSDSHFRVYVMLGYSKDYGSCGLTGHNGDSERVALDLAPWPDGGPGGVVFAAAYTAAHEGTIEDHGRVFVGPDMSALVFGTDPKAQEPRWVVYPSAGKHATYANIQICENISQIPCFNEDCAPDGVDNPSDYDRLPDFGNAGEPDMPRVDDLGPLGFPGDTSWGMQDFCGGLGGTTCSSPVRDKLTVDPF